VQALVERIDPKVGADQRGHAMAVALRTYTKTDLASRLQAVTVLEHSFLVQRKFGGVRCISVNRRRSRLIEVKEVRQEGPTLAKCLKTWSGGWDSNPRRPAWEIARAL